MRRFAKQLLAGVGDDRTWGPRAPPAHPVGSLLTELEGWTNPRTADICTHTASPGMLSPFSACQLPPSSLPSIPFLCPFCPDKLVSQKIWVSLGAISSVTVAKWLSVDFTSFGYLACLGWLLNSQQINRINAFFRKAERFGLCNSTCVCDVSEYLRMADSKLFNRTADRNSGCCAMLSRNELGCIVDYLAAM